MTSVPYGVYQFEIYARGLAGERPELPLEPDELERQARDVLSEEAYGYVAGGAGSEATMRANRAAFDRWRIVPRMLRDIAERDLSTTVAGLPLPAPVALAPIGVQSIVHRDGEVAAARAAADLGLPFTLSTASTHNLEDVAQAMGNAPRWFQLYWPNDPELAASLLQRAADAGYQAVLVTLDTWLLGWRPRDLRNAFLPFLQAEGIGNYLSDPVFRSRLERPPEEDQQAAVGAFLSVYSDPTITWERLAFLREHTDLPIFLKGILHPDDARRAADHGVAGVVVSNHGGRQVDGSVGALDMLPQVVAAVGEQLEVLFDSGVRTGADAFKALALGARCVLLGRPYVWGLALAGEEGVRHVLRSFLADLDLTLGLSGHRRVSDLGPEAVSHVT